MTRARFPESFLFGVGTSDHQCEAYDPRWRDVRDQWHERRGLTLRRRATDFWHRYAEDVELAKGLGCTAFRFSVAWARVEPAPGAFDRDVLRHYADLTQHIVDAGMRPVITLLHFTWPLHVEARGGLVGAEFPSMFQRYAAEVAVALGAHVPYWITINEPNMVAFGYVKPWWQPSYSMPPGLPEDATMAEQMSAVAALIRNLFLAHTAARAVIRARHPHAKVGANPSAVGIPAWLQRVLDRSATGLRDLRDLQRQGERVGRGPRRPGPRWLDPVRKGLGMLRALTSTVFSANWWYLGMAGRLPAFLCPASCIHQQDFVGIDYYWGFSLLRPDRLGGMVAALLHGRFDRAPVWPRGLYSVLKYHAGLFPDRELLIVENGCVEVASNVTRADYIRIHLRQVERALSDRMRVAGWLYWSLTSNREWGNPFSPATDFGLYHIALDEDPALTRVPTAAGDLYQSIVRRPDD